MKIKYDNHGEVWESLKVSNQKKILTWLKDDTLDFWRHFRKIENLKPLIDHSPNARWLTVGDGRFGTDAHNLKKIGAKKVHATDLYTILLKEGKNLNFIDEYSKENIENLSFNDNAFDYILCKETLHHLPRPYFGLYELIRVSKNGVVIIEPRDRLIDTTIMDFIPIFIRKILRYKVVEHDFENVGNYVYSLSVREIEKFMLGLNYNLYAIKYINDSYEAGVEYVNIKPNNFKDLVFVFKIKFKILLRNFLDFIHIRKSNYICAIIFN